jgi:hypothetical protein
MPDIYPCPCCGENTLTQPAPGSFEICDKCNWEDDDLQFHDPDLEGGANMLSLNQARMRYKLETDNL